MIKKDYYQTLGISKSANDREIKKAYKKLAMKYHPDRNQGDKNSEKKFKEIKEAYEVLIDPQKRTTYDQHGHSAFDQGGGYSNYSSFDPNFSNNTDFSDIFGDVFGDIFGTQKKKRAKKGADLQYNLELSLEEAVRGLNKTISITTFQTCSPCFGTGSQSKEHTHKCQTCNGSGQIHLRQGFFSVQQTCSTCQGAGEIISNPCLYCKGTGRIKKEKKILVKIPPGVDNQDKIKLKNEGEAGKNNANAGDLYIKIFVKKHPFFQRKENNLYCTIPINICIATLGGEIQIPTLEGKINIKIPPETQSGKLFRIRHKGVTSIRTYQTGDLLCQIMVETPINLNQHQKKLFKELQNSLNENNTEKNNQKSKKFFEGVKKFFDDLTG
ncbi:molecular chaperone DnaJ [Buchnera aphidicola]|uniref:Chaperone protein DnaJ n=1 Tax=Buchnera aphidicola (Sarucallis kahawaluokalani) TaxID=1241878 RepID=A0A4D6YJL3_9GAMM|nr:molecular chaperone DnaJ [Buchnera aphidicola]QCI25908.1 molecular chaperone DnaJ [Buchnera aphidicola (Sarucallis kahawaluokalani)]